MLKPYQDPANPLYRLRHSMAHVLAQAVLEIRPNAKLGYGPPTEHGFFYDFELDLAITPDDFADLEMRMRRVIAKNQPFEMREYGAQALIAQLEKEGKTYKAEMAKGFMEQGEKTLSIYQNGDFSDMCEGPHVESTGKLPTDAFKIDSLAGAYWKGDQSRPMLQRIYGLAFERKADLKQFLRQREMAKQRDHRKLGSEMGIFTISDEVGKGLPLWMPNGEAIKGELERLAMEIEHKAGYQRVSTPHITKEGLYHTSGHLPYYAKDMFAPMETEEGKFYLRPMNCPHHHMIYKAQPHSHRDLPLRLAEYGMCYRYEQSGELAGLLRVRALQINDAHIYCTPEQSKDEFIAVMQLHLDYYRLFGIERYWMRLSLPEEDSSKYVGERPMWEEAEEIVIGAMDSVGIPYESERGEAAFYGPKIDMQITNVIGREETASTNQLDLVMAKRFNLTYIGVDNQAHHPHILHRAPLGSHERFIAFLIEHYGGVFPTWLAPLQLRILPVGDAQNEAAYKLATNLRNKLLRVNVDANRDTLGKKMRNAQQSKTPNVWIMGSQEVENQTITWRRHGEKQQKTLNVQAAQTLLLEEVKKRLDWRALPGG